jgi:hypothetical protein
MAYLDAFILTSTVLVFFSLIEVLVTTILDNNQQTEWARKLIGNARSRSLRNRASNLGLIALKDESV